MKAVREPVYSVSGLVPTLSLESVGSITGEVQIKL